MINDYKGRYEAACIDYIRLDGLLRVAHTERNAAQMLAATLQEALNRSRAREGDLCKNGIAQWEEMRVAQESAEKLGIELAATKKLLLYHQRRP